MIYQITHTTQYNYSQAVSLCHSEARLQPRELPGQRCLSSQIQVSPEPVDYHEMIDFFGNRVAYFALQQSHTKLIVTAVSEVEIEHTNFQTDLSTLDSWEVVLEQLQKPLLPEEVSADAILEAKLYCMDSEMASASDELKEYAAESFKPGVTFLAVATDLTQRIYQDFIYDPGFTTIATPLSTVLQHKKGVCQDFAHLAIACFRSFGLPARYVSGYIETTPPTGTKKLAGSDESHAWFSVYVPGCGWQDFDPTNNCRTNEQHVTTAWGRDYSDVTPLKGLAVGGNQHQVSVSVDMIRV